MRHEPDPSYAARVAAALETYERLTGRRPPATALDPARPAVRALYDAFRSAPFRIPLPSGDAEERALRLGVKPLLRRVVTPPQWEEARARFASAGLATGTVPFEVGQDGIEGFTAATQAPEAGLARPAGAVGAGAGGGRVIGFAGRDPERVARAVAANARLQAVTPKEEWVALSVELGALLGYPPCCTAAYVAAGPFERNADVLARAAARTERFLPLLDVATASAFHMVAWYPCRFDCAASLALARPVDEDLRAREPAAHAAVHRFLALPRLYVDERRQVILDGVAVSRDEVTYRGAHTPLTFDRRTGDAAFEWVFFVDVVAPLLDGDALRVREDVLEVCRGGAVVARVPRPAGSVWLPFGAPG